MKMYNDQISIGANDKKQVIMGIKWKKKITCTPTDKN